MGSWGSRVRATSERWPWKPIDLGKEPDSRHRGANGDGEEVSLQPAVTPPGNLDRQEDSAVRTQSGEAAGQEPGAPEDQRPRC